MADRFLPHLLLVLALLGTPLVRGAVEQEDQESDASEPLPWYQVEVILVELRDATTAETFVDDARPRWPRDGLELGPVWPQPVRPRTLDEVFMLWEGIGTGPELPRVTPGLTPEVEDLIRRLRARDADGGRSGLEELIALFRLRGEMPTSGADDAPDAWAPAEPYRTATASPGDIDPESAAASTPVASEPATAADADGAETETAEPEPLEPEDIEIPMALAFRTVAPERRLLDSQVRRLERSGAYRVLFHGAWRQPFETEAPALPVMVQVLDPDTREPTLIGSVGIELRRYLHAEVDLYWRGEQKPTAPFRDVREMVAFPRSGEDSFPGPDSDPDSAEEVRWVHIVQNRRMRSGETHYVDHPRVAAIIRVEPFALAQPLTEDGEPVRAVEE